MTHNRERFAGKRVIISGASKGIGRATAIRFAQEGARVALMSRTKKDLEEMAAIISAAGGEPLVVRADVTQEDQVQAAVQAAADAWGGLDIVVSNAGIEVPFEDTRVDQLDLAVWQRVIDTNLTGQFLTCKYGVRQLLKSGGGAVILVGSPCAIRGFCFHEHAYSASKGAILSLMHVMAVDYAQDNIRVNACIPGFIDTPMNAYVMSDPALLEHWCSSIPMRRPGTAEETAAVILFLASDEAAYVLGSAYVVDGGQLTT
jgi:NAD(P)-dependent dehydrogenase (short-subunit alcohol dehydrogenase family)